MSSWTRSAIKDGGKEVNQAVESFWRGMVAADSAISIDGFP
jgi:hypothetical protein